MIKTKILQKIHQKEKILSEKLAPRGPTDLIIVLDGLKPDFNVGKAIRSAEAFGVAEVFLINIPFFDTRIARGCFRKIKSRSFNNFSDCHAWLKENQYSIFVFDLKGERFLHESTLPQKSAFVFGHEEFGPSFSVNDYPEIQPLRIKQKGKVESLNVSIAASIAMYEYSRQF